MACDDSDYTVMITTMHWHERVYAFGAETDLGGHGRDTSAFVFLSAAIA